MTVLRIAVWNVENLGANWDSQFYTRGLNSGWLADFIAAMVQAYNLHVIAIQEVFPGAGPHLQLIVDRINASYAAAADRDWTVDWIRQGFGQAPANLYVNNNIPDITGNDADQLYPLLNGAATAPHWDASPLPFVTRHEAYALFWRGNQAHFKVAQNYQLISEGPMGARAAAYPNGVLNLVARGRPFDYLARSHGGFNAGNVYSLGNVMPKWPLLGFPFNSTLYTENPRLYGARRAAYAVLTFPNLGGGQANQVCPLIFYHAPAAGTIAPVGTSSCAMARELFVSLQVDALGGNPPTLQPAPATAVVAQTHACVGGDFNYGPDVAGWPGKFGWFTAASGAAPDSGGGCAAALVPNAHNNAAGRSAVRLSERDPHNHAAFNAITTANTDDYLGDRLDNGFNRGPAFQAAYRIDLADDLLNNAALRAAAAQAITDYTQLFQHAEVNTVADGGDVDANAGPRRSLFGGGLMQPIYGDANSQSGGFTNWNAFKAEVLAGQFATARSAAEFLRKFISDHLPVVAEFNV